MRALFRNFLRPRRPSSRVPPGHSLAGDAVLFFLIFIVIGMGVYYLVGRRHGTRIRVRLVKGAVYGLLAAGLLMPVIIQFDMYVL